MRNFQDTFETRKRSIIGDFSICMTVPLRREIKSDIANIGFRVLFKNLELSP